MQLRFKLSKCESSADLDQGTKLRNKKTFINKI